jgi:hypothetical protein
MTNSQQSMTQHQSPQKRLRIEKNEDGTATTATTTTPTQQDTEEEREEIQDSNMEDENNENEFQEEQNSGGEIDTSYDEAKQDYETTNIKQIDEVTTKPYNNDTMMNEGQITTPIAEGNFEHQFENKDKDKLNSDPFLGRNHGGSQQ